MNTSKQEVAAYEFDRMRARILDELELAELDDALFAAIRMVVRSTSFDCQKVINGLLEERRERAAKLSGDVNGLTD